MRCELCEQLADEKETERCLDAISRERERMWVKGEGREEGRGVGRGGRYLWSLLSR